VTPVEHTVDEQGQPLHTPRPVLFSHARYLVVLTWAFTFFSSVRGLSYLPTMWAIWQQGDSSQHSLLTWCTWLGANLTMAGWLHEHNGRRFNTAVTVNLANAAMCALTVALIAAFR
jgi:hypothetical protein